MAGGLMKQKSNKIGRANRRPAFPLDAERQFGSASSARPSLSAAVTHLWRSAETRRTELGAQ